MIQQQLPHRHACGKISRAEEHSKAYHGKVRHGNLNVEEVQGLVPLDREVPMNEFGKPTCIEHQIHHTFHRPDHTLDLAQRETGAAHHIVKFLKMGQTLEHMRQQGNQSAEMKGANRSQKSRVDKFNEIILPNDV